MADPVETETLILDMPLNLLSEIPPLQEETEPSVNVRDEQLEYQRLNISSEQRQRQEQEQQQTASPTEDSLLGGASEQEALEQEASSSPTERILDDDARRESEFRLPSDDLDIRLFSTPTVTDSTSIMDAEQEVEGLDSTVLPELLGTQTQSPSVDTRQILTVEQANTNDELVLALTTATNDDIGNGNNTTSETSVAEKPKLSAPPATTTPHQETTANNGNNSDDKDEEDDADEGDTNERVLVYPLTAWGQRTRSRSQLQVPNKKLITSLIQELQENERRREAEAMREKRLTVQRRRNAMRAAAAKNLGPRDNATSSSATAPSSPASTTDAHNGDDGGQGSESSYRPHDEHPRVPNKRKTRQQFSRLASSASSTNKQQRPRKMAKVDRTSAPSVTDGINDKDTDDEIDVVALSDDNDQQFTPPSTSNIERATIKFVRWDNTICTREISIARTRARKRHNKQRRWMESVELVQNKDRENLPTANEATDGQDVIEPGSDKVQHPFMRVLRASSSLAAKSLTTDRTISPLTLRRSPRGSNTTKMTSIAMETTKPSWISAPSTTQIRHKYKTRRQESKRQGSEDGQWWEESLPSQDSLEALSEDDSHHSSSVRSTRSQHTGLQKQQQQQHHGPRTTFLASVTIAKKESGPEITHSNRSSSQKEGAVPSQTEVVEMGDDDDDDDVEVRDDNEILGKPSKEFQGWWMQTKMSLGLINGVECSSWIGVHGHVLSPRPMVWHTSLIASAPRRDIVRTVTGSLYKVQGELNAEKMRQHGFSDKIIEAFAHGFPPNWKKLLKDHYTSPTIPATVAPALPMSSPSLHANKQTGVTTEDAFKGGSNNGAKRSLSSSPAYSENGDVGSSKRATKRAKSELGNSITATTTATPAEDSPSREHRKKYVVEIVIPVRGKASSSAVVSSTPHTAQAEGLVKPATTSAVKSSTLRSTLPAARQRSPATPVVAVIVPSTREMPNSDATSDIITQVASTATVAPSQPPTQNSAMNDSRSSQPNDKMASGSSNIDTANSTNSESTLSQASHNQHTPSSSMFEVVIPYTNNHRSSTGISDYANNEVDRENEEEADELEEKQVEDKKDIDEGNTGNNVVAAQPAIQQLRESPSTPNRSLPPITGLSPGLSSHARRAMSTIANIKGTITSSAEADEEDVDKGARGDDNSDQADREGVEEGVEPLFVDKDDMPEAFSSSAPIGGQGSRGLFRSLSSISLSSQPQIPAETSGLDETVAELEAAAAPTSDAGAPLTPAKHNRTSNTTGGVSSLLPSFSTEDSSSSATSSSTRLSILGGLFKLLEGATGRSSSSSSSRAVSPLQTTSTATTATIATTATLGGWISGSNYSSSAMKQQTVLMSDDSKPSSNNSDAEVEDRESKVITSTDVDPQEAQPHIPSDHATAKTDETGANAELEEGNLSIDSSIVAAAAAAIESDMSFDGLVTHSEGTSTAVQDDDHGEDSKDYDKKMTESDNVFQHYVSEQEEQDENGNKQPKTIPLDVAPIVNTYVTTKGDDNDNDDDEDGMFIEQVTTTAAEEAIEHDEEGEATPIVIRPFYRESSETPAWPPAMVSVRALRDHARLQERVGAGDSAASGILNGSVGGVKTISPALIAVNTLTSKVSEVATSIDDDDDEEEALVRKGGVSPTTTTTTMITTTTTTAATATTTTSSSTLTTTTPGASLATRSTAILHEDAHHQALFTALEEEKKQIDEIGKLLDLDAVSAIAGVDDHEDTAVVGLLPSQGSDDDILIHEAPSATIVGHSAPQENWFSDE